MSRRDEPISPDELRVRLLERTARTPDHRLLSAVVTAVRRMLEADGAGILLEDCPYGPGWTGASPRQGPMAGVPLEAGISLAVVHEESASADLEELLRTAAPIVRLALRAAGPLLPLGENRKATTASPGEILGESPAMEELFAAMARAAPLAFPVLILGETGTGKDLVARNLHGHSARASGPFVPIHCGALPESLVEGELFGHRRGSFTGATADRPGLVEEAHGGTLFLDELGELPPPAQATLLRFLQDGETRRIGDRRSRRLDVRVVAATHRELEAEVAKGRFREDLYYRLHVLPLRVPPLRRRGGDLALLAEHFLSRACGETGLGPKSLSRRAEERILAHAWPGNVRQLENVLRAAVARAGRSPLIHEEHLPLPAEEEVGNLRDAVRRFEARRVGEALERAGGSRTRAARLLGISRQTLYTKLARLEEPLEEAAQGGSTVF